MNKINVFIPAAGLGERLRPITNHIPKPLIPVLGRPAIQRVLDNISALPVNKIGINLHHKKEAIEEWVRRCPLNKKITLFPEEKILGTGGALKNAEGFLKEGPFFVHNSDILSDIHLNGLLEHHQSSNNLVTLAIHDYPKFNSVVVDENGFFAGVDVYRPSPRPSPLRGEGGSSRRMLAFTGIAVYESGFLDYLPNGKSSVVDAWLRAAAEGRKIGTFDVSGCCWSDIGSPDAYAATVFELLRREGETVYIHPSIEKCADADMQGHVVIEEGCLLEGKISLKNCIVLPGGRAGAIYPERHRHELPLQSNCILGPDFKITLNETEILKISDDGKQLIGTGGSDRKYFRTREGSKTFVLMQCREDDPDFERQIEYTRLFQKHSVPVPELIEADIDQKKAVLEDAGDISLYSWLKCPRDRADIENIYRQIINMMVLIHTEVTDDISACPLLENRIFDYDHFRWETDYFIKRFAEGVRNINVSILPVIDEELHQLAVKADAVPKAVIHRDFQSQNIMVMKGQELRLIDYQGARLGPPAYDVASLLWDPYYRLEDEMRVRLLDDYIDKMKAHCSGKFDDDIFRDSLILCRLQRHMQALGAYGFLSLVKGKKYFQKYMPEGIRLLKDDACHVKDEYPELYKLIMGL
jgi:NDP-sugar pyrophosphorylase family protein/aminoglycoside/choline kinase family phosphotransferase